MPSFLVVASQGVVGAEAPQSCAFCLQLGWTHCMFHVVQWLTASRLILRPDGTKPGMRAAGCVPGNALAFLTLYLQLLGMSDLAASCITVAFLVGQAFGAMGLSMQSTLCIEDLLCLVHRVPT